MAKAFGLEIPRTLEEVVSPERTALLVYDMQVGILGQIKNGAQVTEQVLKVLEAARTAGMRVFFCRHLSLPLEAAGAFQMRMAMAWQHVDSVSEVHPWFLRDAPGFELLPALAPRPSEVVFDKITMSAFESTFLNIALRDCGIHSLAIVGVATEIGIDPTARHAADLCYIPILITDACGAGHPEAAERSLASLAFAGDALFTDTGSFSTLLAQSRLHESGD